MAPTQEELLNHLSSFLYPRRYQRFTEIIENRTRHITIVLEDIFQSHNASAVMRSCDCFGFQDVHLIENDYEFALNPDIALGADKWLSLHRYNEKGNNTTRCLTDLKNRGYLIVATSPHKNQVALEDFPIEKKSAILFGTELNGLSQTAMEMADMYLHIPMAGFTESLNISVCAGIMMHHIHLKLINSEICWQLSHEEKIEILLNWARKSIRMSESIEKEFYSRLQ